MKICGIIAEYNPFHTGHAYHIQETKRILGEDTAIICVMSGNYVQRGEAAIIEKYQRARAAARCGADLVLELPLSACLYSAEGFAWGGVELLHKLGCVDYLSFGSECGDLQHLSETVRLLESDDLTVPLRSFLHSGLSYAAARQKALETLSITHAKSLETANNTLGIAYLHALHTMKSSIQPLTIKRIGAAHDAAQLNKTEHPSASALRQLLHRNKSTDCFPYLPTPSSKEVQSALRDQSAPVSMQDSSASILAHLRRFQITDIIRYTSGDEGLANRLYQAIRTQTNLYAVCSAAQTRCYPLARIRRTLLRMYLSLDDSFAPTAHYARVLAIGPNGREILRSVRNAEIPVIIKPASEKELPDSLHPFLHADALADNLYALMQPNEALHIAGAHFRKTPFVYSETTP